MLPFGVLGVFVLSQPAKAAISIAATQIIIKMNKDFFFISYLYRIKIVSGYNFLLTGDIIISYKKIKAIILPKNFYARYQYRICAAEKFAFFGGAFINNIKFL